MELLSDIALALFLALASDVFIPSHIALGRLSAHAACSLYDSMLLLLLLRTL